jgi:hypothetical protein
MHTSAELVQYILSYYLSNNNVIVESGRTGTGSLPWPDLAALTCDPSFQAVTAVAAESYNLHNKYVACCC